MAKHDYELQKIRIVLFDIFLNMHVTQFCLSSRNIRTAEIVSGGGIKVVIAFDLLFSLVVVKLSLFPLLSTLIHSKFSITSYPFDNLIYTNIIHLFLFDSPFFTCMSHRRLSFHRHSFFGGQWNNSRTFLYSAFRISCLPFFSPPPFAVHNASRAHPRAWYCIIFNFMTFSLNLFIPFHSVYFFSLAKNTYLYNTLLWWRK